MSLGPSRCLQSARAPKPRPRLLTRYLLLRGPAHACLGSSPAAERRHRGPGAPTADRRPPAADRRPPTDRRPANLLMPPWPPNAPAHPIQPALRTPHSAPHALRTSRCSPSCLTTLALFPSAPPPLRPSAPPPLRPAHSRTASPASVAWYRHPAPSTLLNPQPRLPGRSALSNCYRVQCTCRGGGGGLPACPRQVLFATSAGLAPPASALFYPAGGARHSELPLARGPPVRLSACPPAPAAAKARAGGRRRAAARRTECRAGAECRVPSAGCMFRCTRGRRLQVAGCRLQVAGCRCGLQAQRGAKVPPSHARSHPRRIPCGLPARRCRIRPLARLGLALVAEALPDIRGWG